MKVAVFKTIANKPKINKSVNKSIYISTSLPIHPSTYPSIYNYTSMALWPSVRPWPLSSFLILYTVGGSGHRKTSTYTQDNKNAE
jgi:hypothetical protein